MRAVWAPWERRVISSATSSVSEGRTDRRGPGSQLRSAYLLLTSGRISSSSAIYQWLNVLSGAGFIITSGWNGAYPSAFVNVIWMSIGIYGVILGARVRPGPAA